MEIVTTNTQDTERKVNSPVTEDELRDAIRTIIRAIGEDPEREGLLETPDRIIRMYREIFRGYNKERKPNITTFRNSVHSSEMVFDSGDYYSMCEHHILPFFGKYYFAYVPSPDGSILGISKVARVVGYCAARLQLQERLAREVVEMLAEALGGTALGFAIVMRGKHLCKSMRGVRNSGDMCVSYFSGCFKDDAQLRNEFYDMVQLAK
jgi:GTP cyclohydrolase IA